MTEIKRWPDGDYLMCGCKVSMRTEGGIEVLMYFPCSPDCPTVSLAQEECEKAGKPWERRRVSDN